MGASCEMKMSCGRRSRGAGGRISWLQLTVICLLSQELVSLVSHLQGANGALLPTVAGSLIIGDSAFEVQEIRSQIHHEPPMQTLHEEIHTTDHHLHHLPNHHHHQHHHEQLHHHQPEALMGAAGFMDGAASLLPVEEAAIAKLTSDPEPVMHRPIAASGLVAAPLPPLETPVISESRNAALEDVTDGDRQSRAQHDFELRDAKPQSATPDDLSKVLPAASSKTSASASGESFPTSDDKAITGKIVDFELESAGGHNKAKIKKKHKKMKEAEEFKKWGHKKSAEKKAVDMMHKQAEKKKKSEGHKGKKKWGKEVHGHKKKGNFKKKKWGEKVKKGHGLKKGKKGKKFLKDVGHKNTGFKTVYHKEEWGKSSKWHDIDRQKKWDEKSKKWKKNWKKEKGKKYKGNHMKKFEKKKKSGKKYSKKNEDKFKKYKKEEFEKGKKKKMEQKSKKKEGGEKKAAELMKKKKKKGMY